MKIDLHTHSYFSDGEHSPKIVIEEAKKEKISVFSITDHNILPNNGTIKSLAKKNGIIFLDGIEISTLWRSINISISLHVLGYGKKLNRDLLNGKLKKTIEGYNHRAQHIINKLNILFPDIHLNFDAIKSASKESYISRNTLAHLLVIHLRGSISIKEALKEYVFINEEDDSWMLTPKESFKLILDADGIPVLAHSGRELKKMGVIEYKRMVRGFKEAGLAGLEAYYPKHTEEEIEIIRKIANEFDLYLTGGSDWHGKKYTPDSIIGMEIAKEEIRSFLDDKKIGVQ